MNRIFFLFPLILALLGASCRSPHTTSVPVPGSPPILSQIALDVEQFDSNSFYWFMELIAEQVDLPTDLIQHHTFIAKPYGSFSGVELREIHPRLQAIVLAQESALCTNYFLMTTDGNHVIDQRLIAEICDPGPASKQRSYTQYDFLDSDEVLIQTIMEQEVETESSIVSEEIFVYHISGDGKIERCTTTR